MKRERGKTEGGEVEEQERREEAKNAWQGLSILRQMHKCSGRSVTQNSVLSVLQPLPDVAASLRKHTHTLNTSYLCVFFSLCGFPNKSRLNSLREKEALFGRTFLAGV